MYYIVVDLQNDTVHSCNKLAAEEMVKVLIAQGVEHRQIRVFHESSALKWAVSEYMVKTVKIAD